MPSSWAEVVAEAWEVDNHDNKARIPFHPCKSSATVVVTMDAAGNLTLNER